jgi:hypothetical protein
LKETIMRISIVKPRTLMLVAVPAAMALLLTYLTTTSGFGLWQTTALARQPGPRPLIALPTEWVGFEAKVRVFSADMEKVEGRLFRASDGSQRLETGPAGGPVMTIDIRNVPEQTHYLFARLAHQMAASWTSAPMDVPEWGGRRPMLRAADQPGVRKHPFRLSVGPGDKPNVFASEGFEVYEYHDLGGNTHLQAPELNMVDLVNQSITGRREELYDVVVREPSPELFLPPPGVDVERLSIKRGMVRETQQAHAAHVADDFTHRKEP